MQLAWLHMLLQLLCADLLVAAAASTMPALYNPLSAVSCLQKVKLVDAGFIWTEPHSKRLKVKLTIQAEVFNGTILQQGFVVEFVVENHMCLECNRNNANPNSWTACVQVGQGVGEVHLQGGHSVLLRHYYCRLIVPARVKETCGGVVPTVAVWGPTACAARGDTGCADMA
jgi:hypothetical protein